MQYCRFKKVLVDGSGGVTPAGIAQTLDATVGATAKVAAYDVPAESTPVADIHDIPSID